MPKKIPQSELDAIIRVVNRFSEGASFEDIVGELDNMLPRRTLQRRLALLVEQKRLVMDGRGRGSRYRLPAGVFIVSPRPDRIVITGHPAKLEIYIPLSPEGKAIKQAVRGPKQSRRPMGYNHTFLDDYRPNETFYLSVEIRQRLFEMGRSPDGERPAGNCSDARDPGSTKCYCHL